jgi:hypothetical protein
MNEEGRHEMNGKQTLQDRVIALEKQNRAFRRLVLGLALAFGVLALLGFTMDNEPADANYRIVYASKFALRDPRTGKIRAELSHQTMPGGWAGMTLWDDKGNPRAEFKLWEDGTTHLVMMDAGRRTLAKLSVSPDGEPRLVLGDKEIEAK